MSASPTAPNQPEALRPASPRLDLPLSHSILARKTILIVDDEKRMADSLQELLTPLGYTVQSANNGAQAIDILRQKFFHVLVTDLRMQGIGGLDIIRYTHEKHPRTLIIVITGYATTESAIEAVHYNVFDYLRKPFEFDLLRMAIEKAFHKIETDQLREDTAAMITHDIKVPLTSIIGFATMIHDRATGQIHERAAEFSETIRANGQRILELIENYLTSCKADSGVLNLTLVPVDPRQLTADVVDVASLHANRQGCEIIVFHGDNLPSRISIDEQLIFRALENLVQNAIKYCAGNKPIELRCEFVDAPNNALRQDALRWLVINETDELIAEHMSELFERYARAGQTGIDGTGLGLYVVRAVTQAHGGLASAMWLEGSKVCFEMLLPIKTAPADSLK